MKCYKCGCEIPSNSVFCNMCGVRLKVEEEKIEEFDVAKDLEENTESIDFDTDGAEEYEAEVEEEPVIFEEAISNIRFCRFCGRQLSEEDLYCPSCGNNDNGKKRNPSYRTLVICIIAALLIFALITGVGTFMRAQRIEGEWVCQGNDIFSMFETTYIEFNDDGTAEYYDGMFSHQEWKYSYNPFNETLTVCDIRGGAEKELHIQWLGKDSFVLLETGMTFVRTDVPDTYEDSGLEGEFEEF